MHGESQRHEFELAATCVGCNLVPRHARLGRLDALVQAQALFLRAYGVGEQEVPAAWSNAQGTNLHDRVLGEVVGHRLAHVALRAETLLDVVCERWQGKSEHAK